MKTLLALMLLVSFESQASFNRFWVGYKKENLSTSEFLSGLNHRLFPDTILVNGGRGLTAYQPFITLVVPGLPAEIALVMYESEEKYKAIRSTPEGEAYGNLHWDFFQKETSKSTVAIPFTGTLAVGGAYQVNPSFTGWKQGATFVGIYENNQRDLRGLSQLYARIRQENGLNDAIILVTDKWIMEYRSYRSNAAQIRPLPLRALSLKVLPATNLGGQSVGLGEGANIRF